MHPIITIFCAFTRRWAIDRWLSDLALMEHDPALTNLCFIVDCDEQFIVNELTKYATRLGYRSFHVKMNPGWRPNEVRLSIRRQRVAEIHEQAKDLIAKTDGDFVLGLEDDTVFDTLQIKHLLDPLLHSEDVGFVEGVQMGRWGANIIGAWYADKIDNPRQVETLLPEDGYQEITGGGWYGYITRRRLFLEAPYFTSPSLPWGPDVNFGFYVQQQGYCCMIDWQTVFGHNDHGQIMYPNDPKIRLAKVIYNKSETNGKWERTDHEPTRY